MQSIYFPTLRTTIIAHNIDYITWSGVYTYVHMGNRDIIRLNLNEAKLLAKALKTPKTALDILPEDIIEYDVHNKRNISPTVFMRLNSNIVP